MIEASSLCIVPGLVNQVAAPTLAKHFGYDVAKAVIDNPEQSPPCFLGTSTE
ncbi:hypothetical protein JOE34_001445 [Pseudomonas sp. PvP028]|nr:hypothetical protein [Pseudomonas sp. PvP028]